MTDRHAPVLLDAVRALAGAARRVADCTLGDGGHAEAFLAAGAEVLGIDRDPAAIQRAAERLEGRRLRTVHAPFASPEALAAVVAFRPDCILLDLGVSSRQLDDEQLGFTFRRGAPLDMRMGREGATAADLLNTAPATELARWFADYADEPRARRLAAEVERRRARVPFATSDDFVNAIRQVLGPRSGPGDFARLFQALRIAVNDELEGLGTALPALRDALTPGGTLAVISYHSGEDRVVKRAFREWAASCICPPAQPVCTCRGRPLGRLLTRKAAVPSPDEIASNPRARSAASVPSRLPMTLKGRHWVMLWLALFLGVATVVQVRQTAAYRMARRVAALRQERATLEARQADLERRIREASSRPVLGRIAQDRLGLHFPRDSEQAPLPLAPAGR